METLNPSVSVSHRRHVISAHIYETSVWHVDTRFYATWFCLTCSSCGQTGRFASEDAADRAGSLATEKHHASYHGDGRASQ